MAIRWFPVLVVVMVVWCGNTRLSRAAVISIDFGSEWMKVALVKPGVPMEIVLNKESKRKTAAVVSIRNGDRLFGDPALNAAVKHPKSAYRYLQLLVGQKFESPMVKKYQEWFPFYDIRKDEERGTVLFQHDEDTTYSVEELVAMLFNNSRNFASDYAGVPIRDVVITVPPFFNQAQRRSVLQSAALVGLNVLQLMSDNAAAGLNYGLFRQASFNTTPHYIMFYDMGACSTTTTVIEYRMAQVKEGTIANVHPQLTIKGIGYNRFLGGLEMEIRLQLHLAKLFEARGKTKGNVFDSPRAMAKLLKEAKRVKQVLSANSDHFAQIEGLLEDVDFRVKVTRVELEEMCSDILEKVRYPVEQALDAADMTMDEIDAVVLLGGGTRVPKVQENLIKAVKKSELGKSLNTDEAVALGAVYQGAGRTKLFRVKKFIVKEGTVFPIQVAFNRVTQSSTEDGEEVSRSIKRTLFQLSSAYPSKKVLTFNRHSNDFSFQVFYGELDFLSEAERSYLGRLNISEVYLAGVGAALKKHTLGEAKGIKAHFQMDESGLLNLTNVESIFEYAEDVQEPSTLSKIGSTISNFFGMGGEESLDKPSPDEGEEIHADGNETATSPGMEQKPDGAAKSEEKESETELDSEGDEVGVEKEEEPKEEGEKPKENGEVSSEEGEVSSEEEEESSEEEEGEVSSEEEEGEVSSEEEEGEVSSEEEEGEVSSEEEVVAPSAEEEEEVEDSEPSNDDEEPSAGDEEPSEELPTSPAPSPDSVSNDTSSSSPPNASNATNTTKKGKDQMVPKGSVVKVNLTAEVTVLDFPLLTEAKRTLSIEKLVRLQEIDEEKVANAKAKNSLEAHIFETKDTMYSEIVERVSTNEQREVIVAALNEGGDWMEEEGYIAETKVYKEKLRELKKTSRALFKRVKEVEQRPKLLAKLAASLNISHDFLERMKNLTSDIQIFTEVEMTTLETLINETEEWIGMKMAAQKVTPPHEEPAVLSFEIEDHTKRLDREIMYLLKKLRSHPPPNLKPPPSTNKSNTTTSSNATKSVNGTSETIKGGNEPLLSDGPDDGGGGGTLADDPDYATTPINSEPVVEPSEPPEINSDTSEESAGKTGIPSEEL